MNDLVKLKDLFFIEYGNQLDLNKLEIVNQNDGVNFVSRQSFDLGVQCKVKEIKNLKPYQKGNITVTLGGSYLLSAFVQQDEFYTGQNIKILKPKITLNDVEKYFYCYAISTNRFRYSSHGREANKTLDNLLVPAPHKIPAWVYKNKIKTISKEAISKTKIDLNIYEWQSFEIGKIFKLERGTEIIGELEEGQIPLISASETQNGLTKFVNNGSKMFSKSLTIANNGSVGASFFQDSNFFATPDVTILVNDKINKYNAMFISTIISKERYRFSYGRKWSNDKMRKSQIKLPATPQGEPDWEFMENYIKSLPYSASL
jgi:hypothetical protein